MTTLTLSAAQRAWVRDRVEAEGLSSVELIEEAVSRNTTLHCVERHSFGSSYGKPSHGQQSHG